jgi:sulfite reductase (NADPH) hemoprotein beta-component
MALIEALAKLPTQTYTHPISSTSSSAIKLNPYLPLPTSSSLLTDTTYLPSLPRTTQGVVHVLDAQTVTPPRSDRSLVIISRSAQEAYDHGLIALRVAKDEKAVVYHFVAPSALDGEVQEVTDAKAWLDAEIASPKLNGLHGDEAEVDGHLRNVYELTSLNLLKITRRVQKPFEHRSGESSKLIINFTTSPIEADNVLDISLVSPLPKDKIASAAKDKEVVVVEGGDGKFGAAWASVVDAVEESTPRSILVGSGASSSDISSAINSGRPVSRIGKTLHTKSISSSSIVIPSAETTYTSLLDASPSPIEILNDPKHLHANETTSPLYAFGKAVAIRQERERLVVLAKKVLKASGTSQAVHEALAHWLVVRDEAEAAEAGKKVESAIGSRSGEEAEIVKLGQAGHWEKRALWIVISNSWATDLASSGLHHALASALDINLLVYETAPSPFSPNAPAQQPKDRKKDLALYALNMGDVYVASVAVYADYAGVLNAMREAEAYPGPGLVLAYLPWGEKEDGEVVGGDLKTGPLERLQETKRAVAGGWWPMFRWNPLAAEDKRFTLDSAHIKTVLSEFLDRQSHLSQLTLATPAIDSLIVSSVGTDLVAKRKEKARAAYDALLNSLDGPGLLVLYASDGGNAEKVAKRLVGRAKMRGVAATIKVMDEIAHSITETFAEEKNILLITSTAGQGEAPQNGREFFKAIGKLPKVESAETKFTVFAMGDSKYWPRKEDYIYYNKAGKDMFNRLTSAGFPELLPLGLGDDSDPDGYMTGYKPFEAGLWRALGVDSVEVAEVQEETVANEHIKTASNYLRGTILDGLADTTTGAIGPSDGQLTKFHGTYMQVSTLFAIVAKLTMRMIEISEIRSRSRVLNPLTRS